MRLVFFVALLSSCDQSGVACVGSTAPLVRCSCQFTSQSNSAQCLGGLPNIACCASAHWPGKGETCECGDYWPNCYVDANSCSCKLGNVAQPGQSTVEKCSLSAQWRCCNTSGSGYDCTCSTANQMNGCPSGTVEVRACSNLLDGTTQWEPCTQSTIASAHGVSGCTLPVGY
jgi:hypothetical protein